MQRTLKVQFFLTIWPPKWHLRSLRLKALTHAFQCTIIAQLTNCISGVPWGWGNYQDDSGKSNMRDAIPAASQQWQATTELQRFDVGNSDVSRYEGNGGDTADADKEKKHSKEMMDEQRIPWTQMMATVRMWMRRNKHHKPMTDQGRIWRTEGVVQESAKIEQYISDGWNTTIANLLQRQATNLKWRLYCNKWQHLKAKHAYRDLAAWIIYH